MENRDDIPKVEVYQKDEDGIEWLRNETNAKISDRQALKQQFRWWMKRSYLAKSNQDQNVAHRCRDGKKNIKRAKYDHCRQIKYLGRDSVSIFGWVSHLKDATAFQLYMLYSHNNKYWASRLENRPLWLFSLNCWLFKVIIQSDNYMSDAKILFW